MTRRPPWRERPGLVASDLDGTLLRSDGTVSARGRAALAAVERAGVPLVLVTGRPPRWMPPVVEQTGHHGVAICANGAVRYDLHAGRVLATSCLDPAAAAALVAALRAALPAASFAVERGDGGFGYEKHYPAPSPPAGAVVAPAEELVAGEAVKVLVRHPELTADALLAAATEAAGHLPVTLTHSSTGGLLEVAAAGVTKASALALLAAERGVAAEQVLAFGDMPNDVPLLSWAGWGVAVANAHPAARAAADAITGSNDQDGVAAVLDRWF